jgi:hypothetical protein
MQAGYADLQTENEILGGKESENIFSLESRINPSLILIRFL